MRLIAWDVNIRHGLIVNSLVIHALQQRCNQDPSGQTNPQLFQQIRLQLSLPTSENEADNQGSTRFAVTTSDVSI